MTATFDPLAGDEANEQWASILAGANRRIRHDELRGRLRVAVERAKTAHSRIAGLLQAPDLHRAYRSRQLARRRRKRR